MRLAQTLMMLLLASTGCGGSQDTTTAGVHGHPSSVADDLDVPEDGRDPGVAGTEAAGTEHDSADAVAESDAEPPAVTFRLVNNADEDLVFSLDRGWQPVIFAYSGKPPNATPILMFPTFCTASCEVAETDRCPVCPEPEKVRDVKAAEQREVVAARSALEVPWDGMIHVYEPTEGVQDGTAASCECYRTEPVPDGTYTVRACGLRLTQSATASTKYQCVEGSMSFPSEEPQVIEFEFAAPAAR